MTEHPGAVSARPSSVISAAEMTGDGPASGGILVRQVPASGAVVFGKTSAGFDERLIATTASLLRDAVAERFGALKFIVFEFAHGTGNSIRTDEGFDDLVAGVTNLILDAPIVTIAAARGHLTGPDLELALACSMLIADRRATFGFGTDPVVSVGTYGLLAQKIGFVRAERLMERETPLSAEEMKELLLVKEVLDLGEGSEVLDDFLRRAARRHNASYGIYRAQRIAGAAVYDRMSPPSRG